MWGLGTHTFPADSGLPIALTGLLPFSAQCNRVPDERRYALPLKSVYMRQIDQMVGLI